MKPRCLRMRSDGGGDTAHRRPPASVSLRPILYREFYFAPAQLRVTSRLRFIYRRCRVYRFLRPYPTAFPAVVFPRGIPTYLHNRDYSSDFPPSICLCRCSRSVRVYSSISFRLPFSPVTNDDTLVSIEVAIPIASLRSGDSVC